VIHLDRPRGPAREPDGPITGDGNGGFYDLSGAHYPLGWRDLTEWTAPFDSLATGIATGHVIETSVPISAATGDPYGWMVFHHRAVIGAGVYTIQQFADGMQQELKQAAAWSNRGRTRPYPLGAGGYWGPVHARNLSADGQEAIADSRLLLGRTPFSTGEFPLGERICFLVRKHTALPGRAGHGWFRVAPVSEGANNAGRVQSGYAAQMEDIMADIANYNDATFTSGARFALVLYGQAATRKTGMLSVTPVTSISCAGTLSSVRDRKRVSG